MDIQSTKKYNKQVQRMYTLAVFDAMISVFGLIFNYYKFDINFALFLTLLFANFVALAFYQPQKIIMQLSKGREYQMGFNALTKKGEKNV